MKISPTQFFFYISQIVMFSRLYLYSALYIYVYKTNNCFSLFIFCSQFSLYSAQAYFSTADGCCIYVLSCKLTSLLHLCCVGSSGGARGAMWCWRGKHTPQPHALSCGSCGLHHHYHQTRRLGANQSSSANCRGIKGKKKNNRLALLWCLFHDDELTDTEVSHSGTKVSASWSKTTLHIYGPNCSNFWTSDGIENKYILNIYEIRNSSGE